MHKGALTRPQVDPALGLELLESLTDRLAADPELVSQLSLPQVLPRLKLPADDQLEKASKTA